MIIEIKHPIASLRKHFGKLQRNLNSVFYQKI